MTVESVDTEPGGRRSSLVEAAAATLLERGIEATRFSDVADRAGVSIGLLQHYFGSHDALIEEAIEFVTATKFARLEEARGDAGDPWGLIVAVIDEVLATRDPIGDARGWIDICSAATHRERVNAAIEKVQERWVALLEGAIEDGVARGELEPALSPNEAARAVNALVDGMELALAAEGRRSRADAAATRDLAVRAAWGIVGGAGARPPRG